MTAVITELDLIQRLDFDADERVPCGADPCDHVALWRVTATCCGAFQSFVCPEHRSYVEWLSEQAKWWATCSECKELWTGIRFHPLKEHP
jgi:hypothetical protein